MMEIKHKKYMFPENTVSDYIPPPCLHILPQAPENPWKGNL
jgi:hypothetical protein